MKTRIPSSALALSVGLLLPLGSASQETAASAKPKQEEPVRTRRILPPPAAQASTVRELIRSAAPWVIALRIEREEDLPVSRLRPRRLSPETRAYFERPPGVVTGLLVDPEGYVLTSHYNAGGKLRSVTAVFPDGTERPAKLVARNEHDDLALLRVEPPLPPAAPDRPPPWADVRPPPGRFVFVLGRSPDPRSVTSTQGIVSAVTRHGGRALQTDAKLNYGNAGGPLIDLDGRIVGVATFVGHTFPQWGLNSGIGFAAHSDVVREAVARMRRGEDVEPPEYPFLGVASNPRDTAERGAVIEEVIPGSAAAKAGLVAGDVIIEFDGEPVPSFNRLRQLIGRHKVGDKVKVRVRRGKAVLEFELELGARPR